MTWKVYVLWSVKRPRTYVGCSADVQERLNQHNAGHVSATRNWRPWRVLLVEDVGTYADARRRESYFKTGAGRRRLAGIIAELGSEER